MGGGLDSRCVGCACSADVAVSHGNIRINKVTLLHQVGISSYFMRKMHSQKNVKLLC